MTGPFLMSGPVLNEPPMISLNITMQKIEYTKLQKALHAISALMILWLLMSGFYAGLIKEEEPLKHVIGAFNVSLSLLLIPIFLVRTYVSFGRGYAAVKGDKNLAHWMAFIIHTMMYVLVMLVLVSGILMMDRPIVFFDVFSFPQPLSNSEAIAFYFRFHIAVCLLLALLVTLHIAAVIKHQLAGQSVIKRMAF